MAGTDLVYTIGANTQKFDAAMGRVRDTSDNATARMLTSFQRASTGINNSMGSVEARVGGVNNAMAQTSTQVNGLAGAVQKLQGPLEAVLTGLAAIDATKNIVGRLSDAIAGAEARMASLLQIAAGSQAAGVSTTLFQSLTAQAKDLGVETSALIGMLNKAREASTVRIGEGSANGSAFQNRLSQHVEVGNVSADDKAAFDDAGSQEERIKAVLDLITKLQAEGNNLAAQDLGKAFFGDDFERLTQAGVNLVEALQKAIEGLKTAGGVRIASPEEVARATELKNKTAEINNIYAGTLKQALDDIAYAQDLIAKSSLDWQLKVAHVAENFASIYAKARDIGIEIKKYAQSLGILSPDFETKPAEPPASPSKSDGGTVLPEVTVRGRSKPKPDTSTPLKGLEAERADAVAQYIRALDKARDVAQAELETVGKTNVQRERAIALARAEAIARDDAEKGRRSSPNLTDDERTRVLSAAEATAQLEDRTKDLQQAIRLNADAMKDFGRIASDSLADIIIDGGKASDVLARVGRQLARSLLNASLTGTGPLAGLLGTAAPASAGPNAMGGIFGSVFTSLGIGGSAGAAGGGASSAAGAAGGVVKAITGGVAAAGDQLGRYAKAIMSIESAGSGGYSALGPVTASGDRAYGAYQVMGANVPAWTKSALGTSMTPDEFVKNPGAQDATFRSVFGGYVDKYGPSGAAQAWFGGPGSVGSGGGARDVLGTSGSGYIAKFNDALKGIPEAASTAAKEVGDFSADIGKTLPASLDSAENSLSGFISSLLKGGSGGSGGGLGSLFGLGGTGAAAATDAAVWVAGGGHVTGAGSGTSDSIPARLSNGEFVVNAAAARGNLDLLHAINNNVPGFAMGGPVIPSTFMPKIPMARPAGGNTTVGGMTIVQHIHGGGDEAIAQIARQASVQAVSAHQKHLERNLPGMMSAAQRRGF